ADARLRDLADVGPPLGHLPARDPLTQVLAQLVDAHGRALLDHDARERPLVPTGIGHADHGRLDDQRVAHEVVLELDGRDPLAARLDDVLGPVGDLDVAALVERPDVAGAQPSVVELLGRRVAVVGAGDPRAPHLDLAHHYAGP